MRQAVLWFLPPLLLSAPLAAQGAAQATASAPPPPAAATAPPVAAAQSPAEDLFARKCGSCHTVGKGVRVGPDLKDVAKRRSRSWLDAFVKAPSALLDSDADARNLLAEWKGVRMPDLGLSDADTKMLVDLVIRCSAEPCNLAGKFVPATTATERDMALGREVFLGLTPIKTGGAPCVSCHTVRGTKSLLGGGRLAKDLTNVFARLGDEGLDNALKSPAFPLMNKMYADHPIDAGEAFALRAFLYRANLGGEPARDDAWSVGLAGGLGSLAVLAGLNAAWGRRLRGVRQPLIRRREKGKEHRS